MNPSRSGWLKRFLLSALRIAIALALALGLLWWFALKMTGTDTSKAASLSEGEMALRSELGADVQELAGKIGERNMHRYPQLLAAADFIEDSFSRAGLQPRRDSYDLNGKDCPNIEAEVRGVRPEILSSARIMIRFSDRRAQTTMAAVSRHCSRLPGGLRQDRQRTRCVSSRL